MICRACKQKPVWWFACYWTGHLKCRECYEQTGQPCKVEIDPDKLAAALKKIGSDEAKTQDAAMKLLSKCT
jgi:hypothetical protein